MPWTLKGRGDALPRHQTSCPAVTMAAREMSPERRAKLEALLRAEEEKTLLHNKARRTALKQTPRRAGHLSAVRPRPTHAVSPSAASAQLLATLAATQCLVNKSA